MKLSKNTVWRRIGTEIFLINTDENILYELNETASIVFERLLNGVDKYEIVKEISYNYDIDFNTAKKDVDSIINEMILEGIYEK
ncbi:MAG: PqqD family protein [Elusimicrobiales bacterium]|nr:PqqD family protein [Elusimicrobiales bacterium]